MMTASSPPVEAAVTTVVHLITTLGQGGAERVLSQMVPAPGSTTSDGHPERHVVITLVAGGMFADVLTARGVEVRDLGMRPGRDAVAGTLRLARLLRELQPSVVIAWMYHACLLARLSQVLVRGPRVVWFFRGALDDVSTLPGSTRAVVGALRGISKGQRVIAANSRAGLAQHAGAGFRPREWILIPNPCDTDAFAPPDPSERAFARSELGLADTDVLVCALGRYSPEKGLDVLAEAAALAVAQDARLRFVVAGSGTSSFVRTQTSPLEGLGERRDVLRLLQAADLFVSSSLTEGTPNALLEAMASGVPAVVTDVGDCRDIVGDTGRVVAPGAALELTQGLLEFAALPAAERTAHGRSARRRIMTRHAPSVAHAAYRSLWERPSDPAS
jgi:glycosyltransferase involved in cell wall biosynthesis